jgi:hypothetical protein
MKTSNQLFTRSLFFILASLTIDSFAQGNALPYYSGFDTPTEKAGWTEYRLGYLSTYGWQVGASLSHDYNVGGTPTQTVIDWYVSPALNFSTGATISFKRQGGGFSPPTPDNCEVYFSASSADPALGTYTLIGNISSVTVQYTWQDTVLDIPFFTNSGHVAFKYKTIDAAWQMYAIDSIWVRAKPSTVGIKKETIDALGVQVLPNPFSETADLVLNRELDDAALRVYDLHGRVVFHETHVTGGRIKITRKELSPGVYFLEIDDKVSSPARKKFIIQ